MANAVDYWTLVEPIWLPLNRSWDDPEKFVRKYLDGLYQKKEAGPFPYFTLGCLEIERP